MPYVKFHKELPQSGRALSMSIVQEVGGLVEDGLSL